LRGLDAVQELKPATEETLYRFVMWMVPTVETGRPRARAMRGPVQHCRRNRSIAAMASAAGKL
jgi:hypothetical protein